MCLLDFEELLPWVWLVCVCVCVCARALSVHKYTVQRATVVRTYVKYHVFLHRTVCICAPTCSHLHVLPCTSGVPRHEAIKFDFVAVT